MPKGIYPHKKGYKRPPYSDEWKKNMSESKKKKPTRYWLGRKDKKGRKGADNHFWKGGVTPIHARIRNSKEYKLWRKAVHERDGHRCIWCGSKDKIEADHIKPFSQYPELRFAIDNGRTLCKPCHMTTESYGGKSRVYTINKN